MAALTLVGPRKVRVSADGVASFNRAWPCSELRDTRAYWFEYDGRRDLVDTDCPDADNGAAATAMADDCEAWLFDGTAPAWAPDCDGPGLGDLVAAHLSPSDSAALDAFEASESHLGAAIRESGYDPADWEDGTTEGADDDRDGA